MNSQVAEILIEALPYMRRFNGMTIVIKYGGHAMVDDQLKTDFVQDIILLKYIGANPVIVHGGGPQITQTLDIMGIESKFVRGMRLTDEKTMDVVEMVLGGKVNKEIVARINRHGGRGVGLTGKDGELITAKKLKIFHKIDENTPPEIIDPGLVGKVEKINPEIIDTLAQKGFIPVIAPVGVGENGETYNINADLVASKVAAALKSGRLMLITDVDGVLDSNGKLISSINTDEIESMIQDKIVSGGMIPKLECAVDALNDGVEKVHIINGKTRHSLIIELFTDKGVGTEVNLSK